MPSIRWLEFSQRLSDLPIKRVIKAGLGKADQISEQELAAYQAPFPDVTYKAGAMVWPSQVPLKPEDPGQLKCMPRARCCQPGRSLCW